MQKIKWLFIFLITLALSTIVIIFFEKEKTNVNVAPRELYQVYLDGDKIGVIESKDKLEEYIDKKQDEIKQKYNVSNVYPPKNLSIQKYIGYEKRILSEKQVYELIKEKHPFTVKGWTFRIQSKEKSQADKIIYVIKKETFHNAARKTVEAFVPKKELEAFENNAQPEIKGTGKIIENLYIPADQIKERESFISTDEQIFIDENELTRYLLFGTLKEPDKYIVKSGDTIEQISFNHKLGTSEFLIVNPGFPNANSLLFPGQEVSVGLINPLFNVIVEEHIVEDQSIPYKTDTIYDDTIPYGTTKVTQEGMNGIQRVIQKRQTDNGAIASTYIDKDASYVVKDPIKRIVVKGTKNSGGAIIISSDGNWVWPTKTPYSITSPWGYRWGVLHEGIDIVSTGYGSAIYAARDGVVIKSLNSPGSLGNYITIQHDNNIYTLYAHLSKRYAQVGKTVKTGELIGTMGNSGAVWPRPTSRSPYLGTHLHFGTFSGEPYQSGSRSFNPYNLYK